MRILLALNASPEAERARDLAASIAWPVGTILDVVAVAESRDHGRGRLHAVVEDAVGSLASTGATVRGHVLTGRPASVIVAEAGAFGADLVIVGSRGFGPLPTAVRGSVSAEIVDHAPCPVLVARRSAVGSIVLGVDGSQGADAAVDYLGGFPVFGGRPVTVASVVPNAVPTSDPVGGLGFGFYAAPPATIERCASGVRADHCRQAAVAAAELRAAGLGVETVVEAGDPAHVLVCLANARRDALIVMGTRGHTGLTRLVLGSVARDVLLHAACSVLIVRGPVRERMARLIASFTQRAVQTAAA